MTTPDQTKYSDIKHTLTEFTIALESARQRHILDRALAALGAGKPERVKEILAELERKEP
jgi:hypothetical protein